MSQQALIIALAIFNLLMGLVIGLLAFVGRQLFARVDCMEKKVANQLTEDRFKELLVEAIDNALTKQENRWLNEGRIKPMCEM